MPYYLEPDDREKLKEVINTQMCAECGGELEPLYDMEKHRPYLQCKDNPNHKGIKREASPYEKEGLRSLNIPTRREIMTQQYGEEKTRTLAKYIDTAAITKRMATEIVETLWRDAPDVEKAKAILLCQTYQLNPLMKHIYLIGYKRYKDRQLVADTQGDPILDWSIQIGIGATRLMAQRKHNYSYLDMTPRKASDEEVKKILGDTADPGSIYGFVHIKDIDTGAEAFGLRGIKRSDNIKGQEKGNTHLNQACIRAERQALDRQYPGEMPQGVEVVDERYMDDLSIEGEGLTSLTGRKKSGESAREVSHGEGEADETILSQPKVQKPQKIGGASTAKPHSSSLIDLDWLSESQKTLKWDDDTMLSFIFSRWKVSGKSVTGALNKLTREQAEDFTNQINQKRDQQATLF